jgi:acyl-CoA thioester hydrolase
VKGLRGRSDVPDGAFIEPVRVRSYEVDRRGRLAPGTVLRYLEAVATEHSASLGFDVGWYAEQGTAWVVRDMHLRLAARPHVGDELLVATWVSDYRRVQAGREYAVWCAATAEPVARASARWAYIDRVSGQPTRIYPEFATNYPTLGRKLAAAALPEEPGEAIGDLRRQELALAAREYEVDPQGHINNCVYLDWLTEGARSAAEPGEGNQTWRLRDVQIEYMRPSQAGEALRVVSTLAMPSRRGLWAWQEVVRERDGAVCVRARSQYLAAQT